jgi:hypothetical protein
VTTDFKKMPAELQRALDAELADGLQSGDEGRMKQAADGVGDFIRYQLREDEFVPSIMEQKPISMSELDRRLTDSTPVYYIDMEPGNKGAVILPFGQFPGAWEPKGSRIAVAFARFFTRIAYLDVALLATYKSDLRQIVSDNMIRDLHAHSDASFMSGVKKTLVALNTTIAESGIVHWQEITGGIDRDTWVQSLTIMPSTGSSFGVATGLMNHITAYEFFKWQRNEVGGDKSQDWLLSGKMSEDIMGVKCVKTIKKALVPTNTVFFFASPDVLGRNYSFEAPTMWTQRIGPQVKWMCYMSNGRVLANVNAVAAVTFTP